MKRFSILAFLVLLVNIAKAQDINPSFESFKSRFIEELWKTNPGWASYQGYHKYDHILTVPDEKSRQNEVRFSTAYLDSLKKFDVKKLNSNNNTDFYLIKNQLESTIWFVNEFKSYEWNPSEYNVGGGFAEIISGNYAPLIIRLNAVKERLKFVPAFYAAAKKNIKNPTKEHTSLALMQNNGSISVFEQMLKDSLQASTLTAEDKKIVLDRAQEAIMAIKDYVAFLEKITAFKENSRIGKDLYMKKFDYDLQSSFTADQIFQKAVNRKNELHKEMYGITVKLWKKYFGDEGMPVDSLVSIKKMITKLSEKHVHRDSFQTAIETQIPELVKFISQKDLIYIDPSKPLVVRKEPEYMQGVAGASISAPGPYDKNANTYYNVGSLAGYSEEGAESYLREYNHYVLQILNIHEAIPGHYTQLVYSNQSPSIIKAILGSGAMVEGWAVYTERMMLEEGYGNNEPEMWLMYYKWHLRTVCNTILDYSYHVLGITEREALDLLINKAFQEKAEAEGKWRRATLTSVQLCSYFTGYTEIYELRETLKKKQGAAFNLKKFHEQFLSYGSAPVKYIRAMMVK